MSEEKIPIDRLIKVYVRMRDKLKEIENEKNVVDEQMDVVRGKILEECNTLGVNSLNTSAGRVVRKIATRYWTNDWESMHSFIKENDALELLEKRIHQTNLKTYLETHPDQLPPGLNSDSEYQVTVYRK